jgi:hypothetical protein
MYSTTQITANDARLDTSSITMILDWMLNRDSAHG